MIWVAEHTLCLICFNALSIRSLKIRDSTGVWIPSKASKRLCLKVYGHLHLHHHLHLHLHLF